jgi:hypothetical protein
MKKYLLAFGLLASCVSAHAEENIKFVNADGSPLGDLCIAAVDTDQALTELAQAHGISPTAIDQVYCNGRQLRSFIKQFRESDTVVTAYVVNVANESPESLLCLAAVTSDEEFARLKDAHFKNVADVEREVACNDMPLGQFVRKYRDHLAERTTASL